MSCGTITANVLRDCDNVPYSGVESRFVLLNRADIDTITYDVSNKHIVSNLTLAVSKTGFAYDGIKTSTRPSFEMIQRPYDNVFRHILTFLIFDNDGAIKQEIFNMTKGDIVAIVENKHKGDAGEAAYEIYGLSQGLQASATTRDPNNQDTGGAYEITLQSLDESLEPRLPASLYDTDYATTQTLFETLFTV